jgi:predicted nuclease of predicted toxin-antitoxin system
MKLLLDNQLSGMERYLKTKGYEVTTSADLGYSREADEDYIKYAKENDMIFIMEDNDAAKIAKFLQVEYIHLDIALKSQAVIEELKKR